MALPREPRQKMINIMYLVLTAILALNVSAEILEAFKTVDRSLMNSTSNISIANNAIYQSLKEKLADDKTKEKASYWEPKARQAQKLSADMDAYINTLKSDLKKGAGLQMKEKDGRQVEDFKEDNLDASTRLFETNGKGPEFQAKLEEYKEKMLGLDSAISVKFRSSFPVETTPPQIPGPKKTFTTAYFHMTPTVAALTMLSKFQNNVRNAENQVVTFIHEQIGAVKVIYDKFEPLVSTNATYLMPGQELEIKAGVGAFNNSAKPQVIIQGSNVAVNENGVGTWKQNVNSSGRINVVVRYTKPDGTIAETPTSVEYVVGTPSAAAVMLDKMNVFYIGVDNPVTIGSPSGWDKTSVSMSGGTLSGGTSKRTVRVTQVGPASITVNSDGKAVTYGFRVKRIPDPVFKVGRGQVRMPAVEFKNQQYCRAELENFDFDLKFSVVSSTVYFSGANFPNVTPTSISSNNLSGLDPFIRRCGPGSVVTFDNIKVSGPDGTRSIEGKSIALY